jgi:hypothetical protein
MGMSKNRRRKVSSHDDCSSPGQRGFLGSVLESGPGQVARRDLERTTYLELI